MSLIQIDNVSKHYRLGDQVVHALQDVSMTIEEGVFMAIAGPSGSGKSTLLNLIGCVDTPTSGRILLNGRQLTGYSANQLAGVRARMIGFIFQTFNLFPVLSAEENVEYPLLQFRELNAAQRRERVATFLRVVELERYARHRPNELSGGQRQRVAIARALATKPKIILADEPTANLDHKTGEGILELMKRINRASRTTFVFSTHDRKVIAKADRLIRIEDGRIDSLALRTASQWVVVKNEEGPAGESAAMGKENG